jgi:hypothetical protein
VADVLTDEVLDRSFDLADLAERSELGGNMLEGLAQHQHQGGVQNVLTGQPAVHCVDGLRVDLPHTATLCAPRAP